MFVMIVIASAITRPSVQANRLGLADTHSGERPNVITRATTPIGAVAQPGGEPDQELGEEQARGHLEGHVLLGEVGVAESDGPDHHRQAGGGAHLVLVDDGGAWPALVGGDATFHVIPLDRLVRVRVG